MFRTVELEKEIEGETLVGILTEAAEEIGLTAEPFDKKTTR